MQLDVRRRGLRRRCCREPLAAPLAVRYLVGPVAEAGVLRARRAPLRPLPQAPRWLNQQPCSSSRKTTVFSPRLEHDLEVAAVDRLLRPPAVDDPPLLPDERHALTVDALRRPTRLRFDERRPRAVYSSRGDEQGSLLWYPRPGRHLHDGADRAGAGARPHLAQTFAEPGGELVALRPDELELPAGRIASARPPRA